MSERGAIVLSSGGIDSGTLCYYVKKVVSPARMVIIFCDYGHRTAEYERWCLHKIAEDLRVDLKEVDLRWLGRISTSLLTSDKPIPETPAEALDEPEEAARRILWWWDPCRNAILLLVGLAHAESWHLRDGLISDVYIGIRRETPVPMRDNTPEFLQAMNRLVPWATHHGVYSCIAPFLNLDKHSIVSLGEELGAPWIYTYSCYAGAGWTEDGLPIHCGRCSNCRRRHRAFVRAGVEDPTIYRHAPR